MGRSRFADALQVSGSGHTHLGFGFFGMLFADTILIPDLRPSMVLFRLELDSLSILVPGHRLAMFRSLFTAPGFTAIALLFVVVHVIKTTKRDESIRVGGGVRTPKERPVTGVVKAEDALVISCPTPKLLYTCNRTIMGLLHFARVWHTPIIPDSLEGGDCYFQ